MQKRTKSVLGRALTSTLAVAFLGLTASGCGYSEEEWQAQLDKYTMLAAKHQAAEQNAAALAAKLKSAKQRVDELERDLKTLGVDVSKLNKDLASRQTELSRLNSTLEERNRALALYKARAKQLEAIKARFERLRAKLREFTDLGLKVYIRNNRMIISLPGDVLFASGRDSLKKEGESILDKVANIVNSDPSLRARHYQVAGHTDSKPLKGGKFYDNWGLSLMRSRQVLVYLVDPKKGRLPASRWSAAGFGSTDPVEDNGSKEGRQANRRCEIIIVPSAAEMLNLKEIAK